MVRAARVLFVVSAMTLAGCSGSGGSTTSDTGTDGSKKPNRTPSDAALCNEIVRLDAPLAAMKQADPNDPATFGTAIDAAVAQYVLALDAIKKKTPADVDDALDIMKAEAIAHDFKTAKAARQPLDDWYTTNC